LTFDFLQGRHNLSSFISYFGVGLGHSEVKQKGKEKSSAKSEAKKDSLKKSKKPQCKKTSQGTLK